MLLYGYRRVVKAALPSHSTVMSTEVLSLDIVISVGRSGVKLYSLGV